MASAEDLDQASFSGSWPAGREAEVLTWLGDHFRFALRISAHPRHHLHRPAKATPGNHSTDTHDRFRTDRLDANGTVTLRHAGKLNRPGSDGGSPGWFSQAAVS